MTISRLSKRVLDDQNQIREVFLRNLEIGMTNEKLLSELGWKYTPANRPRLVARLNAVRTMCLGVGAALSFYDRTNKAWTMTKIDVDLIISGMGTRIKTGGTSFGRAAELAPWVVRTSAKGSSQCKWGEAVVKLTDGIERDTEMLLLDLTND